MIHGQAGQEALLVRCVNEARANGVAALPRTCPTCKLGPCHYPQYRPEPLQVAALTTPAVAYLLVHPNDRAAGLAWIAANEGVNTRYVLVEHPFVQPGRAIRLHLP